LEVHLETRANLSDWIAVIAGALGAFIAFVDISIVNTSLPIIQGEIGATPAEGTWIGTSYLVAEIVVIPLTAWLERLFGLRRLLITCTLLFTVFSVVCGLATSLGFMIFGRVGQGLAGGVLIPSAITIVAKRLPVSQQTAGMSLVAVAGLIGPIGGPVLGGWLTESFSWHVLFFVNVPICIFQAVLMMIAMPKATPDLHELRNADWIGIAGMMVGLGCVMTLLEEGHREQWFESAMIQKLAVGTAIGLVLVSIGQFTSDRPVMRLALLRNFRLSLGILLLSVYGTLMFGGLFIVPQFLIAIPGYSALQAGGIVAITGIAAFPATALYPMIARRVDMRILVGFGIFAVGVGCFLASLLTSQSTGEAFVIAQALFGIGNTFAAIPLTQAVVAAVDVKDSTEVSSLAAIARNIGGSLGLASIASFEDQRIDVHHWQLHESLSANSTELWRWLSDTRDFFGGGPDGLEAAYRALDGQVMNEALVMAFNDVFLAFAVLSALAAPLAIFLRPVAPGNAPGAMH
jgi:DHA2 family multidrug resistance protein